MFEDLPEVLTAQDIAKACQFKKDYAYSLLRLSEECGGIRSIRSGRCVRALKSDLIDWVQKRREAI